MRHVLLCSAALSLLLLAGCATNRAVTPDEPAEKVNVAPMATEESTVWEYVRNKYDTDADGFVARAEYDRDTESFERMDRNDDGRLGPDEFTADVVSMKRMHGWATRIVLIRYFQTEDPSTVTWVEIETVFAGADADGDGVLNEAEFAARKNAMDEMRPPPPGVTAPSAEFLFLAMLDIVDQDGNRGIALVELRGFFDAGDPDGDGVWEMPKRPDGARRKRPMGAPVGQPAPDFTLSTPGGESTVQLSSFRGSKPVALIFGSYT
ncbi:MAG: hypothetical protein V3T86_03110 [Planctomycetota bacterium]